MVKTLSYETETLKRQDKEPVISTPVRDKK